MNKNILILTSLAVIVLLGGLYFLTQVPTTKPNEDRILEEESPKMVDVPKGSNEVASDAYVEYSPDTFNNLSEKKKVLFFYASWCPTCKSADSDFNTNSKKFPEDLVVIRINYNDSSTDDNEKALATKYGITYQHTFVLVDENGNEITKWNGGETDVLLSKIK